MNLKIHENLIVPKTADQGVIRMVFYKEQILLETDADGKYKLPTLTVDDLPSDSYEQIIPIGTLDDEPCFAVLITEELSFSETSSFHPLRNVYYLLDVSLFQALCYGWHMIQWGQNTKFCSSCASSLEKKEDERAMQCPKCELTFYPKISPAVIVAVLDGDKILLAQNQIRSEFYSILAGFVEPGESLENCARREIQEESNLEIDNIRYFGSQPWGFSQSLMVGFIADYKSGDIKIDENELVSAAWFTAKELETIQTPGMFSIAGEMIEWFVNQSKNGSL